MPHEWSQEGSADSFVDFDALRRETRWLREQCGVTQPELAKRLGISQASVSAFERGKNRTLRRTVREKLLVVLDEWRARSKIVSFQKPTADFGQSAPPPRNPTAHANQDEKQDDSDAVVESMRQALITFFGEKRVDRDLVNSMDAAEVFRNYVLMGKISKS